MAFISQYICPPECTQPALWFFFREDRLLVDYIDNAAHIPVFSEAAPLGINPCPAQFLGLLDGQPCYAASIETEDDAVIGKLTPVPLRKLFGTLTADRFQVAACAYHLLHWDRLSRFCGKCGEPTQMSATERAKICDACGNTVFPRISPAVIVAVVRDDRILLAHSGRFPGGFYSVLAGFVEPGETLEACVAREVKEEVGIEVAGIEYFGSQHWPFPDSLMIAFTASYAGGEILVDGKEIAEAAWFAADGLPRIPEHNSVSRRLIDWFTESRRRQ